MVYTVSDRLAEPLREPDHRRGTAQLRVGGRTELLGSAGAVLGRSREADVVVDDPNVSRKHAEVRPSGGSWMVRDLGSTNGVKVNGRRIQGPQSLKPGDVIELAPPASRSSWSSAMALDPVAVALKFGFLAVLYLFLLWMARSALKDLRRGGVRGERVPAYEDATGMHHATAGLTGDAPGGAPKLRVGTAAGLRAGSAYDLSQGALLGRGDRPTSGSRTPSPPRSTHDWSHRET